MHTTSPRPGANRRGFLLCNDGVAIETILLVEPDAATLVAESLILRSFGYAVLESASRGEAWRTCVRHSGTIHLIVMQAAGDDEGARGFVARLQLLCPQIRALFISEAPPGEWAGGPSIGYPHVCLHKPFPAEMLADTINELLGRPKKRTASSLS